MTLFRRCRLAVLALLLTLGSVAPTSAQLRDFRYCEVIAVHNRDGALVADVWASIAAGDPCLPSEWEVLDAEEIRQDLGALAVLMNGLRFWVLDFITNAAPPEGPIRAFGNINMRVAATVDISGLGGESPYMGNSVHRDTQFLFRAGQEVYELIAPDGRVYVMQSYSHIVDDTLDEAALGSLGERLALPEGWQYRVRVLDGDYVVEDQSGIATVVQDELANSYQYYGYVDHPAGKNLDIRRTRSGGTRMQLFARDVEIEPHPVCEIDGDLVVEADGASATPLRFALDAGNWRPVRRGNPARGCRYDDGSVVRHLKIKEGKLRVTALSEDLGIPLDVDATPVRIRVRHGERNLCFVFGGDVEHTPDRRLRARDAPIATACPATPLTN